MASLSNSLLAAILLQILLLWIFPSSKCYAQSRCKRDTSSTIDLNNILEHQEGLQRECAKYHNAKVNQLEKLVRLDEQDNQFRLPNSFQVKVPAVCLFLFSQFQQSKPIVDQSSKQRLELVNWIYSKDEIRGHLSNVTKRDVDFNNGGDLLSDYLIDPQASNYLGNEPDSDDMVKFHKNVETMMADDRFKQVMSKSRDKIAPHLSPVILVPGLLGSRLQARTDKVKRVNILCSKQSDWQDMWLSIRLLMPIVVNCWFDNARLELDPQTGFSRQPAGIETRVPFFGSVESVRVLDLRQPKLTKYMSPLIERYEQLGYTTDVNLLAAPYDFRLAPQEMGEYFKDLKSLIERAQQQSPSGKKVTLVCHSMGCTHLLVFLRHQSSSWRQSRIRKLIALSSPWSGSFKALKALVVGDDMDLPLVSDVKMRKLVRTFPSTAFLLPQPDVYGAPNKDRVEKGGPALVELPQKVYKAADMEQLMKDLNMTTQLRWFKETTKLIKPLEPLPDLQVDCIHSLNIPTPETLVFRKASDFPDGDYELIKGEGDGTVNSQSLLICDHWARLLPDKVKHKVIMNTNHLGVMSHKTTLTHITDDVLTG